MSNSEEEVVYPTHNGAPKVVIQKKGEKKSFTYFFRHRGDLIKCLEEGTVVPTFVINENAKGSIFPSMYISYGDHPNGTVQIGSRSNGLRIPKGGDVIEKVFAKAKPPVGDVDTLEEKQRLEVLLTPGLETAVRAYYDGKYKKALDEGEKNPFYPNGFGKGPTKEVDSYKLTDRVYDELGNDGKWNTTQVKDETRELLGGIGRVLYAINVYVLLQDKGASKDSVLFGFWYALNRKEKYLSRKEEELMNAQREVEKAKKDEEAEDEAPAAKTFNAPKAKAAPKRTKDEAEDAEEPPKKKAVPAKKAPPKSTHTDAEDDE